MAFARMGHTSVVAGDDGGRYPHGNSLLVAGAETSVIIDPSLSLVGAADPPHADMILSSHAHEDHLAGNGHHHDLQGLQSLDGLLEIYGMPAEVEAEWREVLLRDFHYREAPDARGFDDGDTFDLGAVSVRAVHLPGHTRGHSGFLVEPDGVFYVGDIDLSGFGPYYGDAWSDLGDFEASIARCREIDARWYATFHHKGVIGGRREFLHLLDAFVSMIGERHGRLYDYLSEPRTLADIVDHRFVYRPGTELLWVDYVEERMMSQHLDRLVAAGDVAEVEPRRYRAV